MDASQFTAPQVSEWAFDSAAGQISAFDDQGRVLMVIATNPLFAARLAAAFNSQSAIGLWQAAAPRSTTNVVELGSLWGYAKSAASAPVSAPTPVLVQVSPHAA